MLRNVEFFDVLFVSSVIVSSFNKWEERGGRRERERGGGGQR